MIVHPIASIPSGPARTRLARWLLSECRRRGRLVSSGILGYAEASDDLVALGSSLGMIDGIEHEHAIADELHDAATRTETRARHRVREAILPHVANRARAAVIFHAAHKAARADLPAGIVNAIAREEIRAALQAMARRKAARHA